VIEKQHGEGQGSANSRLYSLASADQNPFHATQSGNNSVPGVIGFTANGATYNLATGLGSVDGALLVNGWGIALQPAEQPIRCSRSVSLPRNCKTKPPTPRPAGSGH
jgi:hypothetical protein